MTETAAGVGGRRVGVRRLVFVAAAEAMWLSFLAWLAWLA